jgi:hypothetical protein
MREIGRRSYKATHKTHILPRLRPQFRWEPVQNFISPQNDGLCRGSLRAGQAQQVRGASGIGTRFAFSDHMNPYPPARQSWMKQGVCRAEVIPESTTSLRSPPVRGLVATMGQLSTLLRSLNVDLIPITAGDFSWPTRFVSAIERVTHSATATRSKLSVRDSHCGEYLTVKLGILPSVLSTLGTSPTLVKRAPATT